MWGSVKRMLGRDEHDDLVAQLYAAALGETPWTATLQQLAETFGSSAAILQVSNPGPEPLHVVNYGYSTEFQARYFASEAYFNDPRPSYFYKVPAGAVYFDSALYDVDEMYRNPSVRETCDILKVQYQLGAVMALPHGTRAWLTLLMTPKEGHPSEAAIQAYRRLAPHMEQACALGHLLEHKGAVQSAVLEGMAAKADGVILLGLDGVPSFMNDAAHAIIARGDGLSFSSTGFAARRGPETRRLQQLIGQAIAASRSDSPNTAARAPFDGGSTAARSWICITQPAAAPTSSCSPGGAGMILNT